MIEVKNIYKSYGNLDVLKGVNFEFPDSKITSFLGANAAGKSTLLGVMSRLLKPDRGQILIDNLDIKLLKPKEIAKKLSILKQSNNINIRITIRDLVSFGRFPYSNGRLDKKDKDIINNALNYMSLDNIADKYIAELSGGQRQRAYIAMIMAQDTKYILLDEPINNLDMRYAVEMMCILKNLVKDFNKTLIIVMHDINFAAAYSDYIVAMKDGVICANGTVEEVITKPIMDEVYDHDFTITKINEKIVCIYYYSGENHLHI